MALIAPNVPKQQKNRTGSGGPGALIGGLIGAGVSLAVPGAGVIGALKGAATGASLGQQAGGIMDSLNPQQQYAPQGQMGPLERRKQKLDEDPLKVLREAQNSLPELPKEMQEQLQEPLRLAMERVKQAQVG